MTDPRVAIYIRVSTTHQIDKDSLPMQRKDLISYAKLMLHTENYSIFEDAGYSGKNMERPKFKEMMSLIRSGFFTHVLVWKIDRISRNLLDFAGMYEELKSLGVTFVSKNEQFDTSTAMGEAMLKIILVFAELERSMTSERVTATMISRAASGQWNGGRIPYGYDYDEKSMTFSINEEEAAIVHLIHDTYEQTNSLVSTAKKLNSLGYKSRYENDWSPNSLRIILTNVWYCGSYRYNTRKEGDRQRPKAESEWITVENHHPQIISEEQKGKVIAQLKENRKLITANNIYVTKNNVHVFGGLVICSECGRRYTSTVTSKKGWKFGRYLCPTRRTSDERCKNKSVTDLTLGDFIINYIVNLLHAQQQRANIRSTAELSKILLRGFVFSYIKSINQVDLQRIYDAIKALTGIQKIYGDNIATRDGSTTKNKLALLKAKKRKQERALERLTKIYLYSEDAISDTEFVVQKKCITDALEEVNEEISSFKTASVSTSISDEDFIKRASEFIIAKKLEDRNFVSYERLAKTISPAVLHEFFISIIDSIIVKDGRIKSLTLRNGLKQTFIW